MVIDCNLLQLWWFLVETLIGLLGVSGSEGSVVRLGWFLVTITLDYVNLELIVCYSAAGFAIITVSVLFL